jgi:tRNA1(Val) A37 N6-methylase TrmN6
MEDRLLGGRVHLDQPSQGYRVAIDPVMLAAAAAPAIGEHILDAGCGTAAAALCLAVRVAAIRVTGVEFDPELVGLATANVTANAMADRIAIVEQEFDAFANANRDRFDQVMTNPPFYEKGAHSASPHATKAVAHGEGLLGLDGWIAAAATALKSGGRLTLIHRADCLADILAALDRRFGATTIFPLWPKAGQPAKRIIVTALKGRRTKPALLPGLVLHEADGAYTPEAQAILRHGGALDLFHDRS